MRWTQEQVDAYQARARNASASTARVPSASQASPPKARRAKFNNRKVVDAEGNVHDSGKEYRRWQELELLAHAGTITDLRRQVPYALVVEGELICRYVADFVYREGAATICEDVKSEPTRKLAAYRIKKALMRAIHKIDIREV